MINGFHIGVVVQNNDPLKMGRIKVFVPHISATVYTNWNSLSADKDFSELGSNENESIANVMDDIKDILPWSVPASPIIGESGYSSYNAFENLTGIGDGNESKQGLTEYGDKPAKEFEDSPPQDAYSNSFSPKSYSKLPKGSFSVPKVGSHVWIFHHNGDIMFPVYFAIAYGGEFSQNYSDKDYPDKFENLSSRDSEEYDDEYKNKWVLNQKGATIEVNNTDGQESITISHYDGSFKQVIKDIVREFVQKDEIKLINNDKFETINRNSDRTVKNIDTEYVGLSSGRVVEEDDSENIGNNRTLTVGNNETIIITKDKTCNIGQNYTLTVGSNQTINVSDGYVLTVGFSGISIESSGDTVIKSPNIKLDGDVNITGSLDVDTDLNVDGDTALKDTTINGTPQVGN